MAEEKTDPKKSDPKDAPKPGDMLTEKQADAQLQQEEKDSVAALNKSDAVVHNEQLAVAEHTGVPSLLKNLAGPKMIPADASEQKTLSDAELLNEIAYHMVMRDSDVVFTEKLKHTLEARGFHVSEK